MSTTTHHNNGQPDELITPTEAAAEVGISVEELARMRGVGTGPEWAELTRRSIRYSRRDVVVWHQESNATTTNSEDH